MDDEFHSDVDDHPRRRKADSVEPIQIELLKTQIISRLDQMEAKLMSRIEKIESNSEFMDRTLATRIDSVSARLDNSDKRLDQIEQRAQNNFKLVLTGLIYPIAVAIILAIVLKNQGF